MRANNPSTAALAWKEDLTHALAGTHDATEAFTEASARLSKVLAYDAAVWFATDPETGAPTTPGRVENLDHAHCLSFWIREFTIEDINLFRDLARARHPTATLRMSTGDLPTRSTRYREFMHPQGLGDEIRAVLRSGNNQWGALALYRNADQPPFTTHDLTHVELLTTPLAETLRTHCRPVPQTHTPPADGNPGLLLFDHEWKPIAINHEAQEWITAATPDPITIKTHLDYPIPLWIYSTALRAHAINQQRDRGIAKTRIRTKTGGWITCHATPIHNPHNNHPPTTAVMIEAAKPSETTPLTLAAYALSHREHQITQHLINGLPTDQIARKLHLSPHTIRDYIKNIFTKTGVTSRGQLTATLHTDHYNPTTHT